MTELVLTRAEENYLKSIYKVAEREQGKVSTNAIARELETSAASVTDMIKKLAEKQLVDYKKYRGVSLTQAGTRIATQLVRKHRLWELFLVQKLDFTWDEVHEVAEELEHIPSAKLVDSLDRFLGYPKYDPHGDPIPNAEGRFTLRQRQLLSEMPESETTELVGLKEHNKAFLNHLDELGIALGSKLTVIDRYEYDQSVRVAVGESEEVYNLSVSVAQKLYVRPCSK